MNNQGTAVAHAETPLPVHLASPAALAAYLTAQDPDPYLLVPHLELIADCLVRAFMGEPGYQRLMILMPPRHGKSETCSKWFPTWAFALMPSLELILASHGFEYASSLGRKVRNEVRRHWPELGIRVTDDSTAAHSWRILPPDGGKEGGMECVGVGTSVTGRGADVLILDDPVKDAQDAMSPASQARNWDWWRSTWRTRLNPRGRRIMIAIGTRWDEQDLIGKLLAAYDAGPGTEGYEPWLVIDLPAIADGRSDPLGRRPGDPLWFDLGTYRELETSAGPYWWAAQYQQRPQARGGDLIKEWWHNYWVPAGGIGRFAPVVVDGRECRVVELPALFEYQSWDFNFRDSVRAIERGKEPDPVAGLCLGRPTDGEHVADLFVLDRYHAQVGLEESVQAVRDMSQRHPAATTKIVEYTANGPAVMARLNHELGNFVPATPLGSKVARVLGNPTVGVTAGDRGARAIGLQAFIQSGCLYLPHPGLHPWAAEFRRNLGLFPRGGRDDTDALSQGWAWAQNPMWRAQAARAAAQRAQEEIPRSTMDLFRMQVREKMEAQERDTLSRDAPTPYDRIRR